VTTAGRELLAHPQQALAAWKLRRALVRAVALGATGEITWRPDAYVIWRPDAYVIRLPEVARGLFFGPAYYDDLEVH